MRNNLRNELSNRSGRARWLRVGEMPWSRAVTYELMHSGQLDSVLITMPGSKKGLRLIDGDSLDRLLEQLGAEQGKYEKRTDWNPRAIHKQRKAVVA